MKEFNLSEKIFLDKEVPRAYLDIEDVKEFIRLLKEEFWEAIEGGVIDMNKPNKILDKLAGEKLIQNVKEDESKPSLAELRGE